MKLALPKGAKWASCSEKGPIVPRFPHLQRGPFWRYWGQTTIYTGRFHTAAVYCDNTTVADKVMALLNKEK